MHPLGLLKLWSSKNSSGSPLFCSVFGASELAASDSHWCIADANQYPDYCFLDIVAIVSLHSPFFEAQKGWAPYPQQAYLAAWLWPEQSHTQNSTRWTQRTKLRVFYSAPSPQKGRWEGQGARPPTIAIIQYHWNPNNFRMQISQYLLGPKLLQERTLFCGPTKMCTTGLDLLLRHPCESIISKSYRYYGWGRRPSAE
jgi:hypothetical protein